MAVAVLPLTVIVIVSALSTVRLNVPAGDRVIVSGIVSGSA